jgi:hypothetical protein
MEATYSSEMPGAFQQNTRRYIPEDRTLQNDPRENLKSQKLNCVIYMNCIMYVLCYLYCVSEVNVVHKGLDIVYRSYE